MLVTTVEGVPWMRIAATFFSVDVEAEAHVEQVRVVHAERRLDDFVYEEAIDAFTHTGYNGGLGHAYALR